MKKHSIKLTALVLALVLTAALALTGCGSKSDDTNTDPNTDGTDNAEVQTFKLGTSGPLTGDAAIYGMAVVQGAELAVNEINASDSKIKFEFQKQDDEADGEKAVNAYNNLLDWGAQMMLATVTTNPCIAVGAQAYEDRVFMLTPSASSASTVRTKRPKPSRRRPSCPGCKKQTIRVIPITCRRSSGWAFFAYRWRIYYESAVYIHAASALARRGRRAVQHSRFLRLHTARGRRTHGRVR